MSALTLTLVNVRVRRLGALALLLAAASPLAAETVPICSARGGIRVLPDAVAIGTPIALAVDHDGRSRFSIDRLRLEGSILRVELSETAGRVRPPGTRHFRLPKLPSGTWVVRAFSTRPATGRCALGEAVIAVGEPTEPVPQTGALGWLVFAACLLFAGTRDIP